MLDDLVGSQAEALSYGLDQLFLICSAERVDADGHGFGHPDGIGELYLTPATDSGSHDVLGDVPCHVRRAAVNLRGVFARECTTAVRSITTVGINDDFSPGETGVHSRPTIDEPARRVNVQVVGINVKVTTIDTGKVLGILQDRGDDVLRQRLQKLFFRCIFVVLGRNDDGVNAGGHPILPIFHRYLRFAIGEDKGDGPVFAPLGEPVGHLVRKHDGQRHKLFGLTARIAEHHALIACAAHRVAGSHCNIGGLLVDERHDLAGVGIKARCPAGVADVTQDPPGNALNIHIDLARDLACNEHRVGGAAGLTGHPAVRVNSQHCIQHRIRDTVAHLVWMTLGHRLRRKQLSHAFSSSAFFLSSCSW